MQHNVKNREEGWKRMKVRSDFITNSSSTSFIFGGTNNSESIETVYRLIRVISNEMMDLFKRVSFQLRDEGVYKNYINYTQKCDLHNIVLSTKALMKDEKYISVLQNELKNSFLFGFCDDVLLMCTDSDEVLERHNEILSCNTYKVYEEVYGNIQIIDIKKEIDSELELLLSDILNENNLSNLSSKTTKNFVLDSLGSILVYYSWETTLLSYFDYTLDYFSSCSAHLRTSLSHNTVLYKPLIN